MLPVVAKNMLGSVAGGPNLIQSLPQQGTPRAGGVVPFDIRLGPESGLRRLRAVVENMADQSGGIVEVRLRPVPVGGIDRHPRTDDGAVPFDEVAVALVHDSEVAGVAGADARLAQPHPRSH